MVALPVAFPVTRPVLFTDATAVLLELQLTFWLVALVGATDAFSCCVPFTEIVAELGFNDTLVTETVDESPALIL